MEVRIKRVYDPPEATDGLRVLVDRLWPRGLSKERARVDLWLKEVAPSDALRRAFGHDPAQWESFRQRYRAELLQGDSHGAFVQLLAEARRTPLTLLFAARDEQHNNAVVLRELLQEWDARGGSQQ
ncbi:MAG TPA: DUF488 domain-containing protein [Limnochordia bacterium]